MGLKNLSVKRKGLTGQEITGITFDVVNGGKVDITLEGVNTIVNIEGEKEYVLVPEQLETLGEVIQTLLAEIKK